MPPPSTTSAAPAPEVARTPANHEHDLAREALDELARDGVSVAGRSDNRRRDLAEPHVAQPPVVHRLADRTRRGQSEVRAHDVD